MKKIIALLLALVLVLGLAACGASAPAATEAPKAEEPKVETPVVETPAETKKYEGVELTYWSMWSSGEPQALVIEEAAAAFEAETGAKVNIEWKGRDIKTLLSAALESGENIDVFDDDYTRIGQVYAPYTYDLTEMAAAAGYDKIGYACFNDQTIEWAGFLNSIVEQPNIGGIFYDKASFAAAGVETVPTTWAEFLTVCEQLKAADIAPLALDSAYADFNVYHQLVRHLGENTIKELSANGGWAADATQTNEAYKMVAGEDGTYSLKVTFTDKETADWADGKVAFKVAYGVGGMVANEFWWGDNGNNVVVEPGEYTITFDPATGIVAVK